MAAVLIEYLPDSAEPLTLEEVKVWCRVDGDDEDALIENLVIPAARQLAETRTGAAIRKGRYRDILPSLANYPLSLGQAIKIESVTVDDELVAPEQYALRQLGRESVIDAPAFVGATGAVVYTAGIDMEKFPAIKGWLLLAAAWAYDQRELLIRGQAVAEMPASYADALLVPLSQPPRF